MYQPLRAETQVSVNLTIGATIGYAGWREHRKKGLNCNPGGAWIETLNFNSPVVQETLVGKMVSSGSLAPAVLVAVKNGTTDKYVIRRVSVSDDWSTQKRIEHTRISINEDQRDLGDKEYVHDDGGCDKEVYYTRPHTQTLSGSIEVSYRVPPNVWMVHVIYEQPAEVLSSSENKELAGALVNSVRDGVNAASAYVFVQPGDQLVKSFNFGPQHTGTVANGTFAISFEPIDFPIEPLNTQTLLSEVRKASLEAAPSAEARQRLLQSLMSAVAGRAQFEKTLDILPTYQVGQLARAEFELTNTPLLGPLATEVRAASALASFRTALYLLKAFSPFCTTVDLVLPVSNTQIRVRGITFAYFQLQRARDEITSYSHAAYEAFLAELNKDELRHLTYSEVGRDASRRNAINRAYAALMSVPEDYRPFGHAQELISSVIDKFETLGSGRANAEVLRQQLEDADRKDQDLKAHLLAIARRFDLASSYADTVIDTTLFRRALLDLAKTEIALARAIDSNRRFVSIRESGNDEALLVQMGRLLTFNINIFLTEFKGGAKPIEALRKAFVNKESADTKVPVIDFIRRMEACLLSRGSND